MAHIRTLKQASNHGLILKKVQQLIQVNQKTWLKPYIGMDTRSKTGSKYNFEKTLS